jgi:nucleotide-binding universal stress UspA family protein
MNSDNNRSPSARSAPPDRPGIGPAIVVGLDGSPTSWDAFSWAAGEASRCDGHLVAIYVIPAVEPLGGFDLSLESVAALEQARDELAQQLKEQAHRRATELGVAVKFLTEHGDPAETLTRIARALGASLIVVGKSAKVLHHVAGSLSRRLVSRPDAPVIVVVP